MVVCSPEMQEYFRRLKEETDGCVERAQAARRKGFDAVEEIEIAPAEDVAARVEGLVGPKGVAQRIRELIPNFPSREAVCFEIAREIMEKKFGDGERIKLIEQAVRTGLALFTEGVVSAPIEGVSRVEERKNPDNSTYLAVFFAGPIRGAGGTGQAFTLILGDYCRRFLKMENYRPIDDEVERYIEELNLYAVKTRAGQYVPTAEEIAFVVRNCPVCVDGEPSEDYEVSVHKNIASISTNKVRGGLCLVISEGICLKAAKILKITKKAGLDWTWAEKLVKVSKEEASKVEIKPVEKYMDEIVGGRPIFSYPLRSGGFRLRYGRTRFCGIQSKAIHPATMILLDDFPAFGTQLKTERPGKGCIVTPCENIEGPVVLLEDGTVKKISSIEEANAARQKTKEILFLGDMLVNYGDFSKSNHSLIPCGYNEEWHQQELEKKGCSKTVKQIAEAGWAECAEDAKKYGVPLTPKYTFFWRDLTPEQYIELGKWVAEEGKPEMEWFDFRKLSIKNSPKKRFLEILCAPHSVEGEKIVFEKDYALAFLACLGMSPNELNTRKIDALLEKKSTLELVNAASGFTVRDKGGTFIGTSMGRPEKSRERKMQPPVHVLFPVGQNGGKSRDLMKAYAQLRQETSKAIEAQLENRVCPSCKTKGWKTKCASCGAQTLPIRQCLKCGILTQKTDCSCGGKTGAYDKKQVQLAKEIDAAMQRVEYRPEAVKAVQGLISANKTPEAIEKGILRAKHDVFVFRDGTIRYDATEIPCTHFTPNEVGLTLEKVNELGYTKDADGKPIESGDQTVELKAQDVIVSHHAGDYLLRTAQFVDDLLTYFYGLKPYYNAEKKEDMVGQLVIAIAPHTSAGITSRIIGFTDVQGLLAHPYLHCACRRNADGDELGVMLLMDGLLNFSKKFLPETRGGQMDAPLVLTTILDPREVDDEVHAMDACWAYPLDFYEAAQRFASPSEIKMDTLATRLGTEKQYEDIGFTHAASISGPVHTRYVQLKNMREKVEEELTLMQKIRAVDAQNAAERIILSHFFPDLYGNLRSFSRQSFRCVDCNAKYRRIPLSGKCWKCGGKLLLTVSRGGIEKYLKLSQDMAERFHLPLYLKQRLMLLEKEILSIFEDDKSKQYSLASYL